MEKADWDDWWPQWVWLGECFFWYRLTRVVPDKFHRAVKRLCVCVCYSTSWCLVEVMLIGINKSVKKFVCECQADLYSESVASISVLEDNRLTAFCLGLPQLSRYQKGKTILDFTEARDSEWQWHELWHTQICTWLQAGNHTSIPPLSFLLAGCPSCCPTNSIKALKPNFSREIIWNICFVVMLDKFSLFDSSIGSLLL